MVENKEMEKAWSEFGHEPAAYYGLFFTASWFI